MTDWPPELVAKVLSTLESGEFEALTPIQDPERDRAFAVLVLDAIADDVVLKRDLREEICENRNAGLALPARRECRYVTEWVPAKPRPAR